MQQFLGLYFTAFGHFQLYLHLHVIIAGVFVYFCSGNKHMYNVHQMLRDISGKFMQKAIQIERNGA